MAATFIWGSTFVVVKIGLHDISPLFFVAIRFIAATLLLSLFFYRRIQAIEKSTFQKGVALGMLLCLGFAAQTIGLQHTTASKSGFITGTLVVFTPLMQFIIQRQFPKLGNLVGVVCVTLGLYLLTSPEGSSFNFGDGLTLACAILFAIYIVYLDVISKDADIFQLTFLQIATTGLVSLVLATLFENIQITFSTTFVFSLMYLTVFATLLTTYTQTRFQKDTTPTRAAVIFSLESVFSAILAYLILNEVIGGIGVIGGAIIVVGLLISELSDQIPFLNHSFMRYKTNNQRERVS